MAKFRIMLEIDTYSDGPAQWDWSGLLAMREGPRVAHADPSTDFLLSVKVDPIEERPAPEVPDVSAKAFRVADADVNPDAYLER